MFDGCNVIVGLSEGDEATVGLFDGFDEIVGNKEGTWLGRFGWWGFPGKVGELIVGVGLNDGYEAKLGLEVILGDEDGFGLETGVDCEGTGVRDRVIDFAFERGFNIIGISVFLLIGIVSFYVNVWMN